MQKYLLKQQFEGFSVSSSKGLHKGYDSVSNEDANQKFSGVSNNVSTAYSVSSPSVSKSQQEGSSSYSDEVIHSFFANQSSAPQLDYDDLENINDDDIGEIDLKWQVALISMRIKKFHKRTGRNLQFDTKDPVGFEKTKVECFNCHKMGNFASDCRAKGNQDSRRRDDGYNGNKDRDNNRRPTYQEDSNALEIDLHDEHFVLPIWSAYSTTEVLEKLKRQENKANDAARKEATHENQDANTNSTNLLNAVSTPISTASPLIALSDDEPSYPDDPSLPHLEDIYVSPSEGIFTDSSSDDEGVTRSKVHKNYEAHALVSYIKKQQKNNHKDFQHCLFACFLAQIEPKKISQALEDESWVDAMQEELLQFKIHKVWILVDLPFRKKAIGTKWVYKNIKDERRVVVRNKACLVTQGHRQEVGIYYDKVFAPMARIEYIRIFLAFASYTRFIVYQMDVKSAFLYGTIDEEVYVTQPPGFEDPKFTNKVYKIVKALYGLHQAPRAWYATLSTFLENSGYRRGSIDKTLFIKQDKKDIMLVQVYVDDIIFSSTKKSWCDVFEELMKNRVKSASTPIETQKPLVKDEEDADVDIQVTPKTSHLQAIKKIFRYFKGQPKLGLWYPNISTFDLEAYSDSDYAGANLDRKSTTGGCQFLGRRLILWQCKKQTIMATSTTEAEYVAAAHCVNTPRCDEDSLELKELMVFFVPICVEKDGVGVNAANEELGQAQDDVSIPTEPSTSKPHKKHKSKKQQPIAPKVSSPEPSPEQQLPSPSNDPIPTAKDSVKLQELIDFYTRLSNKVLDLESKVIDIKSYFTDKIEKLEEKVHKLEEENRILKEKSFKSAKIDILRLRYTKHSEKVFSMHDIDAEEAAEVKEVLEVVTTAKFITEVVTTAEPTTTAAQVPKVSAPRRKRGVVIQDPEETTSSVIVHTEVQSKDKGKGILIKEPKPLKGQAQINQDEVFARQLEAELNANINWNDVMEQVKTSERQNNAVMRYQALKRKPLTEAQARKNMMIYLKNMHEIAKKHRMDEEAEELKGHLQIVSNDDDDVYTEATPLASKVHVVDYQIHHENNKPYYKIIRVDRSHKLFLSFITLLKNFDREDLETLWKLVKERFETTEPKNFSDDFFLNILKIMFEKPNIKANMFLLVKKYPLTHFTLEQMLNNVRLKGEEESEISLELLRMNGLQLITAALHT
nr:putative ribonuclease H-like domain-containing protein [Tanacetum cinerariifolium]